MANGKTVLKIIFYAICMPWRCMPTRFNCECGKPVYFKQPACGWCREVIDWQDAREYAHF